MNAQADILVVDDKPENIRLLSTMLTEQGYKVRKAIDGKMALTAVETALPDLILLDINMPVMDGYETCRSLKAEERTREIPVIFVSALDDVLDKVKAFDVGGVDYITKPFQFAEVQARVETHLRLRQLQKELQLKSKLLQAELARAGQVQADLLPKIVPELSGFELAARCLPAREVGGDFFDWYLPVPHLLNLTLGDVMGKGMPAALLMATVRATMRALDVRNTPLHNINRTQTLLEPDLSRSDSFVTLFHAQLNLGDRQLAYVDAGHGHALFMQSDGAVTRLRGNSVPIGTLPCEEYREEILTVRTGDIFVLFSDGLVEVFPAIEKTPNVMSDVLRGATGAEDGLARIFQLVPPDISLPDDLTVMVLYCTA